MKNQEAKNEALIGGSGLNVRLEDGFYILSGPHGEEPCLVKIYTPNNPPIRGLGFGVWDGAAFVPLGDLKQDAKLTPVHIPEFSNVEVSRPLK